MMGLLKKCFMNRRGGLTCPPKRVAPAPSIHSSILYYGNHNSVARGDCSSAERYRRADMLALPDRFLKFSGASG